MLNLAACLACLVVVDTTPAAATPGLRPEPVEDSVVVGDTSSFGNRFQFPFTREEYRRSLRLIKPEAEAEFLTHVIYEPDPEAIGIWIADMNLLLLAALSDDVAQRVIAYRPGLKDAVLRVRENPQAFIAGFGGPPP
jgi:hypothetical protein